MNVITLIIDVSGSMSSKRASTTEGVQGIVSENQDARFNLVEFGTREGVEIVHKKKKAKKLKNYKGKAFSSTPLWDGIGAGLSLIDHEDENIIMIITDGMENSSSKWTQEHVKPLLQAVEAAGADMIFLGADPNAIEAAQHAGIRSARTFSFMDSDAGNISAYDISANMAHAKFRMDRDQSQIDTDLRRIANADKNITNDEK